MGQRASFLSNDEFERFQNSSAYFVERSIIETSLDTQESQGPQKLVPCVIAKIKKQIARDKRLFKCICIAVTPGDGMTWSAEAVNAAIREHYPQFKRIDWPDVKNHESLPIISDFIGKNLFLKLAADHKLMEPILTLRSWLTWAILISAAGLLFFTKLLETLLKANTSGLPYVIIVLLAMVSLASQLVHARLASNPKSTAIKSLLEHLAEQEGNPRKNYSDFVYDLSARLRPSDYPRVVIIDNYEHLDRTTRFVIEQYFKVHAKDTTIKEFWIIFEKTEGDRFSSEAVLSSHYFGYKETNFFEQLLLSSAEKHQLVKNIGAPETATQYTTVKRIAPKLTGKADDKAFIILAEDYRKGRKKSNEYGELELVYLLSLTATPGDLLLDRERLLSDFPKSGPKRRKVLEQFLYGGGWSKAEFRAHLNTAQTAFKSFLIFDDSRYPKRLRVKPEAADSLINNHDKLELPDPELGHLFWGLFWYDALQNHPIEAFWVNKLAYHLCRAEPSKIKNPDTQREITPQLFEALLYTADGCLKKCLFHKWRLPQQASDLHSLFHKAFDLMETDGLRRSDSHQRRLLKKCWEAYSILGDDRVLGLIANIYVMTKQHDGVKDKGQKSALEQLFFETMLLPGGKQDSLETNFFQWAIGQHTVGDSVSDYAKVRAAWLALTVSRMSPYGDLINLGEAVVESNRSLEELTQRVCERINSVSDENIRVTDIITLSLSLWCSALRLNPAVIVQYQINPIEIFTALIKAAEDAVLIADQIRNSATTQTGLGIDFLTNGLSRETYAVTMASILVAYHQMLKYGYNHQLLRQCYGPVAAHWVDTINSLVEFSPDFIGDSLPPVHRLEDLTAPDLIRKIDNLLRFSGIIWDRFNLLQLRDYVNIRRIHFNAICRSLHPDVDPDFKVLLESAGTSVHQKDFKGLISNIVIADCLNMVQDLEVLFLQRAGSLVLNGDFGARLKHEMSLIVLGQGPISKSDSVDFVRNVLEEQSQGRSFLVEILEKLPSDRVVAIILEFLNTSRYVKETEVSIKLKETLSAFIEDLEWKDVKREAESLMEVFTLEDRINNKEELNSSELLKEWKDRKDLWLYPWILELLIRGDMLNDKVEKESNAILSRRSLNQDNFNTYLFLALHLLEKHLELEKPVSHAPLAYLKAGARRWDSVLTVGQNIRVYRTLYHLSTNDTEKEQFRLELAKWRLNELRRDLFQRLPKLLKEGQFFITFREHFLSMQDWGLKTDIPARELIEYFNISDEEKRRQALLWKREGAYIPEPLRGDVVSSEFLYLGYYIFSPPNDQDSSFDHERHEFNEKASEAIPELLDVITKLSDLPKPIGELLRAYSRSLREYTDPTY